MALLLHYSLLSIGRDCFPGGWNSGDTLPKKLDALNLKARWSCVDEGAGTSWQQALPPANKHRPRAPVSLSLNGARLLGEQVPTTHLPHPSTSYPDSSVTDKTGRQDIRDFIASL